MEPNYWLGRWDRGETGWHQTEVEPNLVTHFSGLRPTRVFVPLCGKSLDLAWLASQGHEVVGVELSEMAIRQFFEESRVPFREAPSGSLTCFQGGGITIFQGDFFELRSEQLGEIGAVYDRAALIALPPELRTRYAARMIELLKSCVSKDLFRFLQIVLERTPPDKAGPPHSVSLQELRALYGADFEITPLSREETEGKGPVGSKTEECVYLLETPSTTGLTPMDVMKAT